MQSFLQIAHTFHLFSQDSVKSCIGKGSSCPAGTRPNVPFSFCACICLYEQWTSWSAEVTDDQSATNERGSICETFTVASDTCVREENLDIAPPELLAKKTSQLQKSKQFYRQERSAALSQDFHGDWTLARNIDFFTAQAIVKFQPCTFPSTRF